MSGRLWRGLGDQRHFRHLNSSPERRDSAGGVPDPDPGSNTVFFGSQRGHGILNGGAQSIYPNVEEVAFWDLDVLLTPGFAPGPSLKLLNRSRTQEGFVGYYSVC